MFIKENVSVVVTVAMQWGANVDNCSSRQVAFFRWRIAGRCDTLET